MERKAKRNCALSVRCRYVARQIHRSPGRGLLALLGICAAEAGQNGVPLFAPLPGLLHGFTSF